MKEFLRGVGIALLFTASLLSAQTQPASPQKPAAADKGVDYLHLLKTVPPIQTAVRQKSLLK